VLGVFGGVWFEVSLFVCYLALAVYLLSGR